MTTIGADSTRQSLRYDGAGHFERFIVIDDFAGSTHQRTEDTTYTATGGTQLSISPTTGYVDVGVPRNNLPILGSPWILTPYSRQNVTENGRTYVTDHLLNGKGTSSVFPQHSVQPRGVTP